MNDGRAMFSMKAITGIDLLVLLGLRQVDAESRRRVASGGSQWHVPGAWGSLLG